MSCEELLQRICECIEILNKNGKAMEILNKNGNDILSYNVPNIWLDLIREQ